MGTERDAKFLLQMSRAELKPLITLPPCGTWREVFVFKLKIFLNLKTKTMTNLLYFYKNGFYGFVTQEKNYSPKIKKEKYFPSLLIKIFIN